jgi:predicted DNA-binding protein (UPF0251 family)
MLQLRGVTFEWRDATCHEDGRHLGMIAQQVERIFPEWVKEDENGYLALNYEGFEALTVEAIRELASNDAALENKMAQLEQENAELRTELFQIKKLLKKVANRIEQP